MTSGEAARRPRPYFFREIILQRVSDYLTHGPLELNRGFVFLDPLW